MKFHPTLLAAAASVLIGSSAQAAVLASYEFTGADAAARAVATTSAADLTAGSFSFASAFSDDVTASRAGFSSGGNIFARVTATTASDLTGSITANEYVTVTITPDSGFELNLTSVTVDLGYTNSLAAGVGKSLSTSVFSSVDGFAAANVLGTKTFTAANNGTNYTYENLNIDLTGAAYQNLSGPLEFRIYLYDEANAITDTQPIHRIDNFTLNGAVIPEPSAALLGSLGILVLLRRRR